MRCVARGSGAGGVADGVAHHARAGRNRGAHSACRAPSQGVLYSISETEGTLGLKEVRVMGTEDRAVDGPAIPASDKIFEYVVFQAKDVAKLDFLTETVAMVRAWWPCAAPPPAAQRVARSAAT